SSPTACWLSAAERPAELVVSYYELGAQEPNMTPDDSGSIRTALAPPALRAALVPRRPVFGNPWDSTVDMFACFVAVSVIDPLLLWGGGAMMGPIFNFGSRWPL